MVHKVAVGALLLALVVLVGIMPMALPVEAIGNNYYVTTTGSDTTGDGSSGNPWATIQYAIGQVVSGDTVHVAAGTYNEVITLKDGVELLGAGAAVTTIHGTGGLVVSANGLGSSTKLDGFTITGGNGASYGGIQILLCSSPTVSNCIFSGNSSTYGGGMSIERSSSPIVTNCTFYNNSASACGGGMHIYSSSATVTNCVFWGNQVTWSGWRGFGGGMDIEASNPVITNCTFYGNSAATGGRGMHIWSCSTPQVTNCVLWGDTGTEIVVEAYSTPTITYCDIQGGFAGTGNISQDPLFVEPTAVDFHLQPGSPCINIGNNLAPSLPSTDFEGDTRIWNGVVDMGADEYIPIVIASINPSSGIQGQTLDVIITGTNFTGATSVKFGGLGSYITVNGFTVDDDTQITAHITILSYASLGIRDVTVTIPGGGSTLNDAFTVNRAGQPSQSVNAANGTGTATFATNNGAISGLTASISTPCGYAPGLSFPYGFFSFTITNITPGSTVIITITLPSALPADSQYWKCINGQWVNVTAFLGSNDGDNIITLTLTDGSPNDADGQANGTIVDPGGPCVPAGSPGEGGAEGASTGESQSTIIRTANLRIAMLNVPSQARVNQPITISANVVNDGSETGSTRVALKINGQVEQTKMITVGGGSSRPVKFTVTTAEPGTYSVIMGSQRASFVVTGDGAKASPALSQGMIVMLIAGFVVVAFIVIVAFAFRRRPSY